MLDKPGCTSPQVPRPQAPSASFSDTLSSVPISAGATQRGRHKGVATCVAGHAETALLAACVSETPAISRQNAPLHHPHTPVLPTSSWIPTQTPSPHPDVLTSTLSPGLSTWSPPCTWAPSAPTPHPHLYLDTGPFSTRLPGHRGPAAHACTWALSE